MCTQPRRLAVVAVANRVAELRQVPLGGLEVGYHVGQSNHSLSNTQLLFTTAGILLEELRANAIEALTKYKVIILDECHERSPENDLVLAVCRNMIMEKAGQKIRLVLMSATFDHTRYRQYFSNLDQPVDTITLESANALDAFHERVQTFYLEDVMSLLSPIERTKHNAFYEETRIDPDAELQGDDGGKSLSIGLLNLIRSLVLHLDVEEKPTGVFVIFAPTYRHLEQIYDMLLAVQDIDANTHEWNVHVLHSSIDIEDCLNNMKPPGEDDVHNHPHFRKILLASAIADSSVTIPGVSCVADLCRALQVRWNAAKSTHLAKATWASQSICDQRRGRTGRTCSGRCFRLVPKGFFIGKLKMWEDPLLAMSSCRNEVLKLLCSATAKTGSTDLVQIMSNCLDPPPPVVVADALKYLQSIGACVTQGKKKLKFFPTKMGDLLATLPFSVEDSEAIVAGAQVGLLHEVLALRAIMSHKPAPIVHHFGDAEVNDANILCYYDRAPIGSEESVHMANLSAFLYWDVVWNQSRSKAAMEQFAYLTGSNSAVPAKYFNLIGTEVDAGTPCCNVWKWCPELEQKHTAWCRAHGINPTSVRSIVDLMETAWNVFYLAKLEPEWLRSTDPTPMWRRQDEWKGPIEYYQSNRDILASVYSFEGQERLCDALMFLSKNSSFSLKHLSDTDIADLAGLTSEKPIRPLSNKKCLMPMACVHFLEGKCNFGDKCRNSHSPFAIRPPCKFFFSGGCMKGDDCLFSHEDVKKQADRLDNSKQPKDPMMSLVPVIPELYIYEDIEEWFEENCDYLCMLGEGNFDFTRALNKLGLQPLYASNKVTDLTEIGTTKVFALDATRMNATTFMRDKILDRDQPIRAFAWNFPFTGVEESDDENESLILGTFHSLFDVVRQVYEHERVHTQIRFAISLQGDQFSRWNVLRSAMRTKWRLASWGQFDLEGFPGYQPRREHGAPFPASEARFYEFQLDSRWTRSC